MSNQVAVRCESCGTTNSIDAERQSGGVACIACGHAVYIPSDVLRQVQSATLKAPVGNIGAQRQTSQNASSCLIVGIAFSLLIVVGVVVAMLASASVLEDLGVSSPDVAVLNGTELTTTDFGGPRAMAISHDERWLAYADSREITLFDISTREEYWTIEAGINTSALAFDPSNSLIYASPGSRLIALDVETGAEVNYYDEIIVNTVYFNASSTYAAIRSDTDWWAFDLSTFTRGQAIPVANEFGLPDVEVSYNGEYVFIRRNDSFRIHWLPLERDIALEIANVSTARWAHNSNRLYVATDENIYEIVLVEDIATINTTYNLPDTVHQPANDPIAIAPNDQSFALIFTGLQEFYRYDIGSRDADATAENSGGTTRHLVAANNFLITANSNGDITRWE